MHETSSLWHLDVACLLSAVAEQTGQTGLDRQGLLLPPPQFRLNVVARRAALLPVPSLVSLVSSFLPPSLPSLALLLSFLLPHSPSPASSPSFSPCWVCLPDEHMVRVRRSAIT